MRSFAKDDVILAAFDLDDNEVVAFDFNALLHQYGPKRTDLHSPSDTFRTARSILQTDVRHNVCLTEMSDRTFLSQRDLSLISVRIGNLF